MLRGPPPFHRIKVRLPDRSNWPLLLCRRLVVHAGTQLTTYPNLYPQPKSATAAAGKSSGGLTGSAPPTLASLSRMGGVGIKGMALFKGMTSVGAGSNLVQSYRDFMPFCVDAEKGRKVDLSALRVAVGKLQQPQRREAEAEAEAEADAAADASGSGRGSGCRGDGKRLEGFFYLHWLAAIAAMSKAPQRELLAYLVEECGVPMHTVPTEAFEEHEAILSNEDSTVLFSAVANPAAQTDSAFVLYLLDRLDAASAAELERVRQIDGSTALAIAAQQGLTAVVERLLTLGARADAAGTKEGHLPVCLAVINGHAAVVKALLHAHRERGDLEAVVARPCCNPVGGAKAGAGGGVRMSLFAHALLEGERQPILQLLMKEAGAGAVAGSPSPLSDAASAGTAAAAATTTTTTAALLPEAAAAFLSTVQHLAAYKPCTLFTLRWLLGPEGPAHGASVDATVLGGLTMLHAACSWRDGEARRLEVVKFLCEERGADTTLRDAKGRTAADTAKAFGLARVYAYLTRNQREEAGDVAMARLLADLEMEAAGGDKGGTGGKGKKKKGKDKRKGWEEVKEAGAEAGAEVEEMMAEAPVEREEQKGDGAATAATAPGPPSRQATTISPPTTAAAAAAAMATAEPAAASAPQPLVLPPLPASAAAAPVPPEAKVDETAFLARLAAEAPASFRCPLSKTLLLEPVVASDGYTYQRAALLAYFDAAKAGESYRWVNGVFLVDDRIITNTLTDNLCSASITFAAKAPLLSPVTREALDPVFFPNLQFKNTVHQYVEEKRGELVLGVLAEEDEEALWGAAGW